MAFRECFDIDIYKTYRVCILVRDLYTGDLATNFDKQIAYFVSY